MRSNCLIEAVKAKIKDPKNIQILLIPPTINSGRFHFMWKDKDKVYHYTNKSLKKTSFWFSGKTCIYDIKSFTGTILCRMQSKGWSAEKSYRLTKKLGLDLTLADVQFEFENN